MAHAASAGTARRTDYRNDEAFARSMDRADPLAPWRREFEFPSRLATGKGASRRDCVYLVGNSLGLMPRSARAAVEQELDDWASLGVEAHLKGRQPWFSYHEVFREMGARLVGAKPGEAVMMNSLTANLHLMMVSFYRPTSFRYKIVVEDSLFPSDSYAVASQAAFHGFDPDQAVVRLKPRQGEQTLRTEDIVDYLRDEGETVALVMLGAVNYLTGQWFEMEKITAAGKEQGCMVGWDLAHAAGNVPMRLHDWGVDFAAWCSYKYLNSGPGAVAGCFVHQRHAKDSSLPRFAGWWGNDPKTRFRMEPGFVARPGADGWQLSNPPILAMAPLKASLEIFDQVGMAALRKKSLALTGYLEWIVDTVAGQAVEIVTPRDPRQRGAHLSLAVRAGDGGARAKKNPSRSLFDRLTQAGVVCDFREPNVIRAAPAPLYCSFHDVWRFGKALESALT
ncbi:MAG: kynureninase [Phycisphaeraceae bacterium]|nr:kynureninase [Phycisphaeraceae bacterium]